uniref:bS21m n=1 Tax=Polytomella magna TaxID=353565 RepID=UPI002240E3AA|nr:Chain Bt, bS21m [Polytomella magna]8APN_Bt Chain Bt, bS21m [Polytomella magna]8APO_Bt Chain Bt, bS21m [Polytomella magna]
AFVAEVRDGNVDAALAQVKKYRKTEGVNDSVRKKEYFLRPSLQKFRDSELTYAKNMGKLIHERVNWVVKRKKIKL